jgi:hypothetical protein|tara:strand:+ start:5589 stop:6482 length:894 start_codon:yes stop_codon:yes gene_type:complete
MELNPGHTFLYGAQFFAALCMAFLFWRIRQGASPNVSIGARWIWWSLVALTSASVALAFDYKGHPLWVISSVTLLGWFLLESIYTWLVVSTISQSDLPLFPRFSENTAGAEWPSDEPYIRLRDWLRKNGFTQTQSLIAKHHDEISIRLVVFDRSDHLVRAAFLFFPHRQGVGAYAATFQSVTETEERLITDNFFLPYGGFYPEGWQIERRPRTRSIERLYNRHLARCDALDLPLSENEAEPLEDLNRSNRTIEQLNRELGFLSTLSEDDLHRISTAGRARIWKEIWTLAYFGISRKY